MVRLLSSQGYGYVKRGSVKTGLIYLDKYQVAISRATSEHAGEPAKDGKFKVIPRLILLKPNEVCTASYFLIGNTNNTMEIENIKTYVETKFVRFLVLQAISSINLSKSSFKFVPLQDFSKSWTDKELYTKYELSEDEIEFIENMIRPMDTSGGANNGN